MDLYVVPGIHKRYEKLRDDLEELRADGIHCEYAALRGKVMIKALQTCADCQRWPSHSSGSTPDRTLSKPSRPYVLPGGRPTGAIANVPPIVELPSFQTVGLVTLPHALVIDHFLGLCCGGTLSMLDGRLTAGFAVTRATLRELSLVRRRWAADRLRMLSAEYQTQLREDAFHEAFSSTPQDVTSITEDVLAGMPPVTLVAAGPCSPQRYGATRELRSVRSGRFGHQPAASEFCRKCGKSTTVDGLPVVREEALVSAVTEAMYDRMNGHGHHMELPTGYSVGPSDPKAWPFLTAFDDPKVYAMRELHALCEAHFMDPMDDSDALRDVGLCTMGWSMHVTVVSHSDMGSRGCCGATGATCCPTPAACRNRPGALGINRHDRPAGHSPGAPPTADRALACHERLTKRHVWL
eukprot:jgi/Tetstr1/456378/TSEL_043113.t1